MGREIQINGSDCFYVAGVMAHHFGPFHGLHTNQVIPMVLQKLQDLSKAFQDKNLSIPVRDPTNHNYCWAVSANGRERFSEDEQNGVAFYLLTKFLDVIFTRRGVIAVEGYNEEPEEEKNPEEESDDDQEEEEDQVRSETESDEYQEEEETTNQDQAEEDVAKDTAS